MAPDRLTHAHLLHNTLPAVTFTLFAASSKYTASPFCFHHCVKHSLMLQFPYSMLAAAAIYSAQLAVGAADPFSHALSRHSGYTLEAIQDCAQHLAALWRKAPNSTLAAVFKKVRGWVVWAALQGLPGLACRCLCCPKVQACFGPHLPADRSRRLAFTAACG